MSQVGLQKRGSPPSSVAGSRVAKVIGQSATPRKKGEPLEISRIREILKLLNAAISAVGDVRLHLRNIAETAIAASAEPDIGIRALLAEDFDEERDRLAVVISEDHPDALALLGPEATPQRLELPGGGQYCVAPLPISPNAPWLDLSAPKSAFSSHAEISEVLVSLDRAFSRLERATATYTQDRAFLARRVKSHDNSW